MKAAPMKVVMKAVMKAAMKKVAMKKVAMKIGAMKKGTKKAMKVSKIARGKRGRSAVFLGRKEKTVGGLTKDKLMKNKRGKVVSKVKSALRKKAYVGSKLEAWTKAVTRARKELGLSGMVIINGPTAQGKALYSKAKSLYASASC